jgi:uncharacterized coiled-coil protein SlyX
MVLQLKNKKVVKITIEDLEKKLKKQEKSIENLQRVIDELFEVLELYTYRKKKRKILEQLSYRIYGF